MSPDVSDCVVCHEANGPCKYHSKSSHYSKDFDAPFPLKLMVASEEDNRGIFEYKTFDANKAEPKDNPESTPHSYEPPNAPFKPLMRRTNFGSIKRTLIPEWKSILKTKYQNNALAKYFLSILKVTKYNNSAIFAPPEVMKAAYQIHLDISHNAFAMDPNNITVLEIGHLKLIDFYRFCNTVR